MIKKIKDFAFRNILFIETLFLLAFIPLFPKLPIFDVRNTWVYIRAEDFVVLGVLLSWLALLFRKKISLKTPLTIPILIFWMIGTISTIHGVLLIFPTIANVFPNVAFLSLVRHIEYMSLFFIGYLGMKDKEFLKTVIAVLVITLIGVALYGFGQKFIGFPAYLTSNEEFAKGIPIQLSALARVPSTFAGHYDLAAYLVLIIPILASLFFGFKNWLIKLILLGTSLLGFVLLFMTVSRVSFLVLFAALAVVLFFQKRKLVFLSIPVIIFLGFFFLTFQSSLFDRFKNTVGEVSVVVDARTGESLGHVKFVPKEYFKGKLVLQRRPRDQKELEASLTDETEANYSTSSAILPFKYIPDSVPVISAANVSTGENLTQGTGYINLYLSPVTKRLDSYFYELSEDSSASRSAQAVVIYGDFLVKRASAYDLSFTTRTQGEWPRAIDAFKKNILIGSGYGSVSLAVDNNYLRILGEIGILGFLSFFAIFLSLGIYISKVYPDIDSKIAKSFIIGFGAGLVGLALNATLIDVFEASKIAFLLWILFGITLGLLTLYQKKEINLFLEIKKIATSSHALIFYLFIVFLLLFSPSIENYFVGDDFTWLRWTVDCQNNCSPLGRIVSYFTDSQGFFYRPGTKLYFYAMHSAFWLNQTMYHIVSLFLHFTVVVLFFFLARKILGSKYLSFLASFFFLIFSGFSEAVFWISSTGYLFNAVFGMLGLLSFILWEERKKSYYYFLTFVFLSFSLLFHEVGVVFPLLILLYTARDASIPDVKNKILKIQNLAFFIPVIFYLLLRYLASSHWFSGDYSYDLLKLPFNFIGNIIGYLSLVLFGPVTLPFYEKLREILRENIFLAIIIIPFGLGFSYLIYKFGIRNLREEDKKIVIFGFLFFIISLIPFLGLGNITERYSYLSSMGIIFILAIFARTFFGQLQSQGRELSIIISVLTLAIFSLFHIIQVQQSYFEWKDAGKKTKNFFVSLQDQYANYWSSKDFEFHFTNVPIRIGQAWVFPVGLDSAVWLAFRNDSARIFIHKDPQSAKASVTTPFSGVAFQFNEDGTVLRIDQFAGSPNLE